MIARHLLPFNARKKKSRVWPFFSLPGKLKGSRDEGNARARPKQSTRYELRGIKEERGNLGLQSEKYASTGSEK